MNEPHSPGHFVCKRADRLVLRSFEDGVVVYDESDGSVRALTQTAGLALEICKAAGSITATVQEVLPNGHLVVVGEKQTGVNANVDVLRFSGTIDPRHIRPGNVVASTQVANARIESRNRGAQGEAMSIGWLARFFLSVIPF